MAETKTFQVTLTLQTNGKHDPASIGHWLTDLLEGAMQSGEGRKNELLDLKVKEVK